MFCMKKTKYLIAENADCAEIFRYNLTTDLHGFLGEIDFKLFEVFYIWGIIRQKRISLVSKGDNFEVCLLDEA